jgi:hypothetical protein
MEKISVLACGDNVFSYTTNLPQTRRTIGALRGGSPRQVLADLARKDLSGNGAKPVDAMASPAQTKAEGSRLAIMSAG